MSQNLPPLRLVFQAISLFQKKLQVKYDHQNQLSNNIRERSGIYDILLNQLKYIGNGQNGGTLPDHFIW